MNEFQKLLDNFISGQFIANIHCISYFCPSNWRVHLL